MYFAKILGFFSIFCLSWGNAYCGEGESKEAAPSYFQLMKPLVGQSFEGVFPDGKLTDEQRYEWVYGDKFIRNVHFVRTQAGEVVYQGETIFAFDREKGRPVFWYWNVTGGYLTGWAEERQGRLVWHAENHADPGQVKETRSVVWDISENGYKATQLFLKDGRWEEQWTMEYRLKQ